MIVISFSLLFWIAVLVLASMLHQAIRRAGRDDLPEPKPRPTRTSATDPLVTAIAAAAQRKALLSEPATPAEAAPPTDSLTEAQKLAAFIATLREDARVREREDYLAGEILGALRAHGASPDEADVRRALRLARKR